MSDTSIQWTSKTWNPVRGCAVISPGCTNCYAMKQAHRFSGKGAPYDGLTKLRTKNGPVWTGKVRFVPDMLALPLRWRKPQKVFVNSMSDLFHESLTNEEIAAVFGVMAACPQHVFQILTKRAKRMREWFEWIDSSSTQAMYCVDEAERAEVSIPDILISTSWPLPNVHLGVSVENQQYADERIPDLLRTPAAVRFVSYEPALGPIDFSDVRGKRADGSEYSKNALKAYDSLFGVDALSSNRLDWIIVGGESGPGARPFNIAWARSVIAQCKSAGVACFVKQLGADVRCNGLQIPGQWWPDQTSVLEQIGNPNGSFNFRQRLKDRKGGDMSEWPEDLRVREFPEVRS